VLCFCSYSALDRSLADAAELTARRLDGLEVTAHPPHLDPADGIGAARAAGRAVRGGDSGGGVRLVLDATAR
jgi:hypothetical protein